MGREQVAVLIQEINNVSARPKQSKKSLSRPLTTFLGDVAPDLQAAAAGAMGD
jgi:hypothetical protein